MGFAPALSVPRYVCGHPKLGTGFYNGIAWTLGLNFVDAGCVACLIHVVGLNRLQYLIPWHCRAAFCLKLLICHKAPYVCDHML